MKSKNGIGFKSETHSFSIEAGSSVLVVKNRGSLANPAVEVINLDQVLQVRIMEVDQVRKSCKLRFDPQLYIDYSQVNVEEATAFLNDLV